MGVSRGAGGQAPLEIWDCKLITRKPKKRDQNREKP